MKMKLQKRYKKILDKQLEEGLDILEKLSIDDAKYQTVVVNINNASNISYQLSIDIENQIKASKIAKEEANDSSVGE